MIFTGTQTTSWMMMRYRKAITWECEKISFSATSGAQIQVRLVGGSRDVASSDVVDVHFYWLARQVHRNWYCQRIHLHSWSPWVRWLGEPPGPQATSLSSNQSEVWWDWIVRVELRQRRKASYFRSRKWQVVLRKEYWVQGTFWSYIFRRWTFKSCRSRSTSRLTSFVNNLVTALSWERGTWWFMRNACSNIKQPLCIVVRKEMASSTVAHGMTVLLHSQTIQEQEFMTRVST